MKRFNLLSILILFFTFFGVQCVVADETNGDGASQDGKYATKAYINGEYKVHSGLGDGLPYKPNPLTIKFNYPTNKITYKAWLSDDVTKSHKVILTAGEQNQETELNNDSDTDGLGKDKNDDYTEHKSLDVTNKTIRSIIFTATQNGNKRIFIGDIYVHMAPHILLEDNISKSYTFPETELNSTTPYYTIDFKSFLSSTTGQIEISTTNPEFKIRKKNEEATSNNVSLAGSNVFCSKDNNDYNFDIVFIPTPAGTGKSATITIKDTGSGEKIEITDVVPTEFFEIEGTFNTVGEDGTTKVRKMTFHKCKPQANCDLSFSAENVASFALNFDLLVDENHKFMTVDAAPTLLDARATVKK